MIWLLRVLFSVVLVSMIAVTSWAGSHQALGEFGRGAVIRDPWVIATLLDAYWAFIAFYVWVAWKETAPISRLLWFPALILLGNMAIAAYMLRELFRVPAAGPVEPVFTLRRSGGQILPGALTTIAVAVYAIA